MKDNPIKPVPFQKAGRIILSAVMGLGLFFVLESAVSRHIGFDLLLPFDGGQFLPARLVLLFAALAVCLALGLTERGEKLRRALNAACEKDWARWLVALTVTGLFFLWALRVTVLNYMTIDEVSLIEAIVRIPEQGLGAAGNSFANILFCGLIALFYRLNPNGLWYFGYHLFAILGSSVVIGRCILAKASRRGLPALAGCLVHWLLCMGIFLYTLSKLSFTVTPAVVGSAAVALLLCREEAKSTVGRILSDVGGVALMLLCYLHRHNSGQALLCFWALAAVYAAAKMLLAREGKWKRQLIALVLSAVCLWGLFTGASSIDDRIERTNSDYNIAYWNAEYYRSLIGDYLKDELTMADYAEAGITQELATLIHGWYFMDERVTTELFKELSEIYYARQSQEHWALSAPQRMLSPLGTLFDRLWSDLQMRSITALALCLMLLCVVAFFRAGRRLWPELLTALCAMGGAGILLLYLIIEGRFLIRVFLVVMIPATVTLLIMAVSMAGSTSGISGRRKNVLSAVFTLLCLAAGFFFVQSAYLTPYAAEAVSRSDVFAEQSLIEGYLSDHADVTFVTNIYDQNDVITDPLHPISTYPENRVLWGYCGDTAKDPEERLYADAFFREDVQFLTDLPTTIVYLLQYLTLDYGPVQATLVTQLAPTITVYDIDRVSPGEDYTGWYEQNGLRYYFQNGEAVTGNQIIDGIEYEFAPAGAGSAFFATQNSSGSSVYSTYAYSLLSEE